MKCTVMLEASDAGFAVSVPGLPGCHLQGTIEAEALDNIADAIREYLAVVEEGVFSLSPLLPAELSQRWGRGWLRSPPFTSPTDPAERR